MTAHSWPSSQVFSRLDNAVLTQTMRLDTGEDADFQKIESLIADFESDMDIVAELIISIDAEPYIEETRLLTRDWTAEALNVETLRDKARLSKLQDKTDKTFTDLDIIVELQANESILARETPLPCITSCDQIRFSRIIQSVLSNAVQFNKDGGFIKVQLTELAENKMALDISDTGIGIAQNNIEKSWKSPLKVGLIYLKQHC